MKVRRFEWEGAVETAKALRGWSTKLASLVDVTEIFHKVVRGGDQAVIELTNKLDATEQGIESLPVDPAASALALNALDQGVRDAMEAAAANIRTVAEGQLAPERRVELPEGHAVSIREVPVKAAALYVPGGRAAYPSSVLMGVIPAQVAGVERIAITSPPAPDGSVNPLVLAAAAFCGVEEVYRMGGAQAVFALAYGTETITPVDVIAGPGNDWVREAKRFSYGVVGIDSLAGPSELMVIAGHDADPQWAALDLCGQAEHGEESPVVVVSVEEQVLEAVEAKVAEVSASRPSVKDAPLALVQVPDTEAAIDLANAYAPEHLELLEEDATLLAPRVRTAGCVFVGRFGATAFGDYMAGSNHILPTGGAGRFSGPLGPSAFRRRLSTVEMTAEAARALAPHVDALARAEGFPVHGESAMIRSKP